VEWDKCVVTNGMVDDIYWNGVLVDWDTGKKSSGMRLVDVI
jgi:hypothetical protein